jgi:tetratricopeptide (TPR) repeat protein
MRGELTRGKAMAALAVAAIACGAAAGLLFGPAWAIAGVLVGSLIGFVILAVLYVYPDAAALLRNDQPDAAIAQLRPEMSSWRALARIWPSQFREALASRLIAQSDALQAAHRDEEALRTADEAVAIYQDLAAERPGKYGPDLADALDHQSRLLAADDRQAEALAAMQVAVRLYRNLAVAEPATYLPPLAECLTCEAGWLAGIDLPGDALAAVHEATGICQDKLPWHQVPSCAARAMLLEGELLCGQGRHRQAVRLLAQGWRLAEDHEDGRDAGQEYGQDADEDGRRNAGQQQRRDAGQQQRPGADQEDVRRDAAPAIRAAYRADPDHFSAVWQAETGAEPPDWLSL